MTTVAVITPLSGISPIVLGCDLGFSVGGLRFRGREKWIGGRDVAIGYAGMSRGLDLLRAGAKGLTQPDQPTHDIVESMIELLENGGVEYYDEDGKFPAVHADMIIARPGELYRVGHDFSCALVDCPFLAIGSGEELALGAFHAVQSSDSIPPLRQQMSLALGAALAFDTGSSGEKWIEEVRWADDGRGGGVQSGDGPDRVVG